MLFIYLQLASTVLIKVCVNIFFDVKKCSICLQDSQNIKHVGEREVNKEDWAWGDVFAVEGSEGHHEKFFLD